jgi:hypothetical protein
MLISEASARESQHADDETMATIVFSPNDPSAPVSQRFSSSFVRHAFRDKDAAMASSEARAEELLKFHEERLSWRVYRTACQLRFGYLSFLVLMVLLMFSFTMLMEFFFAIFLPSARTFSTDYVVRAVILLALLPIMLFFLSYFFEEAVRFFFDAINKHDGGLPNFRLALTVVIHYVRHRRAFKAESESHHEGDADDPDGADSRRSRTTIFLKAKDDPFADVDDEEEDDKDQKQDEVEQVRELIQAREEASALAEEELVQSSPARSRWKKVGTAVVAANILKKNQYDGPAIALSTFLVVDFLCPVLFEVITILCFVLDLLDSWSPFSAFLVYVQSGFWLMGLYVVLWMVCHFWSSRNPHMRRLVSHHRRRRRLLRREMRSVAREKQADHLWLLDVGFRFYHHVGVFLNPFAWMGCCRKNTDTGASSSTDAAATHQTAIDVAASESAPPPSGFVSRVAKRLRNVRDTRRALRAKNPWHRLSYNVQAVVLLVACVVAALVSLWSFYLGWPLMGLALTLLSNVIQRRFPQIFGATFRHFILTFVVLSLVFFSSTFAIGTFVTGGNFVLGEPTEQTSEAAKLPSGNLPAPQSRTILYPVCTIDYRGLSVLDLALIADAAYGATPEIQSAAMANRFNGTELADFRIVAVSDKAVEHQVWMEIAFPSLNTTVLAVRGTASAADALEDLHFWFGILIMQAVNVFVPFLRQLPQDFVVNLLSMKLASAFMPAPVYQPMLDHAIKVKERVGDELIVTGHSLGGAMAAMIGARVKAQAVSFSGPGLLYSRGRFDVQAQDVRDYVLTLKPQKDIVPRVDKLGGMVQELRCRHKSPMKCHSTSTHLCELYLSCGDARQRTWAANRECIAYGELPAAEIGG